MVDPSDLELLKQIHTELLRDLLKRIKEGDAPPALLAVARDMLKNNNIQALPSSNHDIKELNDVLATFKPGVKIA